MSKSVIKYNHKVNPLTHFTTRKEKSQVSEKTLSQKIARNILIISHDKNIPQRKIADEVGFSQEMLSQIMRGKKKVPIERLPPIAKALGVTVDELVR